MEGMIVFGLLTGLLAYVLTLWAELPTSLGRTVAFTPVPGKYGYCTVNGVNLNVASWTPSQSGNPLPVTNFNSPKDGNANVHAEDVMGVINTQFDVVGVRDASSIGYHPTVGDTGTAVLGYSATLNYPISYIVTSVGGECSVDGVSGIQFTIKAVGLALMTGRNGGA